MPSPESSDPRAISRPASSSVTMTRMAQERTGVSRDAVDGARVGGPPVTSGSGLDLENPELRVDVRPARFRGEADELAALLEDLHVVRVLPGVARRVVEILPVALRVRDEVLDALSLEVLIGLVAQLDHVLGFVFLG